MRPRFTSTTVVDVNRMAEFTPTPIMAQKKTLHIIGVGVQFNHSKKKYEGDGLMTINIKDIKGHKSRFH